MRVTLCPRRIRTEYVLASALLLFLLVKESETTSSIVMRNFTVNTSIDTRFASTHVEVEWVNHQDCTALYDWTFPLPSTARITSLNIIVHDDLTGQVCTIDSLVQDTKSAQESFREQSSQGRPAALLEAWDTENYSLRVSIPPLQSTIVQVQYEQILRRISHRIPFTMPLPPEIPTTNTDFMLEYLRLSLEIKEEDGGISDFAWEVDDNDVGTGQSHVSDLFQLASSSSTSRQMVFEHIGFDGNDALVFPRQLRGYYDSSNLPEEGVLLVAANRECFVHLFNPITATTTNRAASLNGGKVAGLFEPIARNIVFVIDVSGSMNGDKLKQAKQAFQEILPTLQLEHDILALHSFSSDGVQSSFEPSLVTTEVLANAVAFVNALEANGGTNLNDAYVMGLDRLQELSIQRPEALPVMVVLTDGQASSGTTDPARIATNVINKNNNSGVAKAKIFGLAFGAGADENLLWALSWPTQGLVVRIFDGYDDSADQIRSFYQGELGTVYMADLQIDFETGDGTSVMDRMDTTQTRFSVLAEGTETVVRARKLEDPLVADGGASSRQSGNIVVATTHARQTSAGPQQWMAQTRETNNEAGAQECYQSMAHAKIEEVMNFRKAALAAGAVMEPYAPFSVPPNDELDLAERSKQTATEIALEAQVVWPSLTSLVTNDQHECFERTEGNSGICPRNDVVGDGTGDDGEEMADAAKGGTFGTTQAGGGGALSYSAAPQWFNMALPIAVSVTCLSLYA